MKAKVIINEQHRLMPVQEDLLNERFGDAWELFPVPAEGLDRNAISNLARLWHDRAVFGEGEVIVFASPVPLLLGWCASDDYISTWLFHNDKRVAKEVPDGKGGVKLIHVVAPDGWELVYVNG